MQKLSQYSQDELVFYCREMVDHTVYLLSDYAELAEGTPDDFFDRFRAVLSVLDIDTSDFNMVTVANCKAYKDDFFALCVAIYSRYGDRMEDLAKYYFKNPITIDDIAGIPPYLPRFRKLMEHQEPIKLVHLTRVMFNEYEDLKRTDKKYYELTSADFFDRFRVLFELLEIDCSLIDGCSMKTLHSYNKEIERLHEIFKVKYCNEIQYTTEHYLEIPYIDLNIFLLERDVPLVVNFYVRTVRKESQ